MLFWLDGEGRMLEWKHGGKPISLENASQQLQGRSNVVRNKRLTRKSPLDEDDLKALLRQTLAKSVSTIRELDEAALSERMKKRQPFKYTSQESFHHMPESCPIVQAAITEFLADKVDEETRDKLFEAIKDRVTSRFRRALDNVLEDKYRLILFIRDQRELGDAALDDVLEYPPEETERAQRNPLEEQDRPYETTTSDDEDEGP